MIDHASICVTDFALSKSFYEKVLASIGYELLVEVPSSINPNGADAAGFGANGKPDFWIMAAASAPHQHLAFRVGSRALVDGFYRAGIDAGARDNGAPGVRPQYHPHYYGAFVLDPDGHNIEAVCHDRP
jgi:catechol 2,3-dioxygenase-like lactoylglutathione lyase family enzyme